MKRVILAVLAIGIFAACTKNEVVEPELQEITYQTVVGPQTKALGSGQVEYAGDAFYSTAFFLPDGKTWAANSSDGVQYLADKIVGSGTTWKATTSYYWPKGGTLTFMSYALLNPSNEYVDATSTLVTAANTGVTISGFNVNSYKNHDLLVAAIAKDKDANENVYLTQGVPTLFGHKLCKLVITAQTTGLYSDKVFSITGITLNKLNNIGTYTMSAAGVESWGTPSGNDNVTYFSGEPAVINNDDNNTTFTTITAAQSVYLPQDFQDDETITINYSIKTGSVTENVSITKKLSEVFGAGVEWEMNKIYNINLTFGLQEILWDPAQSDWTDGADGSISL